MALAAIVLALVAASPPGGDIPPPPAPPGERPLLRWMPGDVRCGQETLPAARLLRPYVALSWAGSPTPPPQVWRFRIDTDGRTRSIARSDGDAFGYGAEDIGPSLAASRLPAGTVRDCSVTYRAELVALADAPVGDLVSYSILALNGPLPQAGWDRIRPPGGDCDTEPRPKWLVAVSPDYARLPAGPGARDWTLTGYDLDAKGRPVKPHVVTGTGNAAVDAAALAAIGKSRLTGGSHRGCLNPYIREPNRLAAPADVDLDALRPKDATCPTDDTAWTRPPSLTYPEEWRRRAIEGWAIVAYDVAPWGQIGNTRVLAAEPADAFGRRAVEVVGSASRAPSPAGYTGCVDRVRFRMGPGTFGVAPD